MVDHARMYLQNTYWAPRRERFGPLNPAFYCNVFVADVAREVGGATWDRIARPLGIYPDRDPLAAEWEDRNFTIKGWNVVFHVDMAQPERASEIYRLRRPGDILSGGGHMGIISDDPSPESPTATFRGRTFSASADPSDHGAVVFNDWGFRLPNQTRFASAAEYERAARTVASRFTVRRFVGG